MEAFIMALLDETQERLSSEKRILDSIIAKKEQPSPGLLASIKKLDSKIENLHHSLTLWKAFKQEHPNYKPRQM